MTAQALSMSLGNRIARTVVVGLMVLTAFCLFFANPWFSVWVGSMAADRVMPQSGPLLIVGICLIVGTVILVWILNALSRVYNRVVGADPDGQVVRSSATWEAARYTDPGRHILGGVLIAGLLLAGAAAGLWFALFAGNPLPSA